MGMPNLTIKTNKKEYTVLHIEKETAEKLKKAKPKDKTLSQFIEELLSNS